MALIGSIATVRSQAADSPGFASAFAYIEDLMRPDSPARQRLDHLAAGENKKIELAGGVFAVEQVYQTKPRTEGIFESHRKYIDIQVVVAGEERMEVIDAAHITVREPYSAERDVILYHDASGASELRLRAGEAAVFFPIDVHMPSLRLHVPAVLVRKTVVKVPVV